jgi:hypothetical protein
MEKLGYQKRDLLVGRVEDVQESQLEAKEQFESALAQFRSVVSVDGGELAAKYDSLSAELIRSEARADEVSKNIDSVESVAEDLFEEWEDELDAYSNRRLRDKSLRTLRSTKERYKPMIRAMRRAEAKMEPVLAVFRDQVLFLKHNLNAQAVASIRGELATVESDVAQLIREMESAIRESNEFLETLN